jgi:hypothetical protein
MMKGCMLDVINVGLHVGCQILGSKRISIVGRRGNGSSAERVHI